MRNIKRIYIYIYIYIYNLFGIISRDNELIRKFHNRKRINTFSTFEADYSQNP